MVLIIIAFLFALLSMADAAAEDLILENLIVIPIDHVEVPARATGSLAMVIVREGTRVERNQLIAQLDDSQPLIEAERAAMQVSIAEHQAQSPIDLDLSRKAFERIVQTATLQEITRQMAQRKGANDIRIRASQKAEAVASNELQRASAARKAFVDSVSRSEIDGLTLALERSQLETKQAEFDREMDSMAAAAEDASAIEQTLATEQAQLGIDKAIADQTIAKLKAKSAAKDAELATLTVARHRLYSPIDGVVVKVFHREGEWVQIGEPVAEVLRLDRLRAEGFVNQSVALQLQSLPNVEIEAPHIESPEQRLKGKVVFVMPQVDPVNEEVRFWIEFENPSGTILPGMRLRMRMTAPVPNNSSDAANSVPSDKQTGDSLEPATR